MPPRKKPTALVPADENLIEPRIHVIRGERVLLDSDLAELYGVPTKALNQAVDRNPERFPDDFTFLLSGSEVAALRSQFVTSKPGRGGRRYTPRAFTEHGVAMLSSVLRSDTAVRVNTVQLHDVQIREIADVLRKMVEPPPDDAPKRRLGFPTPEHTHPEAGS